MYIGILCLQFHLEGCSSLKEKRQRLGKLRDKFGKQVNISVCESAHHDVLQSAEWSFVVTSTDKLTIEKTLQQVERYTLESVDAQITHTQVEYL